MTLQDGRLEGGFTPSGQPEFAQSRLSRRGSGSGVASIIAGTGYPQRWRGKGRSAVAAKRVSLI